MLKPTRPFILGPSKPVGKRALVVGLGRFGGGVGVTRWLVGQGVHVTVTDQADRDTLQESIAAVADLGLALHLGGHDPADLDQTDLVIINPAVNKARSEFFQEVVRRNIPWTTEMNLFCERCPAPVIGVTGTYGKSTTCAMLAAALPECRHASGVPYTEVHLGGNIGRSLLTELDAIVPTDRVVLEMSDAQLEDLARIAWAPNVAVITNLSPHHLDRHGSFLAYANAKLNIVRDPRRQSRIIVGPMVGEAEALLREAVGDDRVVRVVPADPPAKLVIPGRHNQANASCVLTTCQTLGLDDDTVRQALQRFPGLPHRLEHVRTLDGVDYCNDSKSTSPSATIVALESIDRPIVAVVGGQAKDVALTECAALLARKSRAVVCTGESGSAFAHALRSIDGAPERVPVHEAARLADAVLLARRLAQPGDVVLLSPGAPSFDQYVNFEARGRHFTHVVRQL